MENTGSTTNRRGRRRFSLTAWAKQNLAPYWGLWLVAVGALAAFAIVIVWFAT